MINISRKEKKIFLFLLKKQNFLNFLDRQKDIIITDYKSRLQEYAQFYYKELPSYKIVKETGPDHDKQFEAAVYLKKKLLGKGFGHSKKEAQQSAAEEAMRNIKRKSEE